MTTTLAAVLAFAVLFVLWGTMRPMDRGRAGCHACPHADEPAGCAGSCALFEELAASSGELSHHPGNGPGHRAGDSR